MGRAKKTADTATRRGHPEAIAKRKAARALNRLFSEASAGGEKIDGRTLKRKRRLMKDLSDGGKDGRPLKALEVLTRANELLALGETLVSLRKLKPKLPPAPSLDDASAVAVIFDAQANYDFDARAWKLLGVNIERLSAPAVAKAEAGEARPRRTRKRAAKKKAVSKTRRRRG